MTMGPNRSPKRQLFTLLFAVPLFLCLSQCAAAPSPAALGAERCGSKPCSSPADCSVGMPVCALTAGATCYNGTECTYKLNTSSVTCPCIEHAVRLCTVPGSGAAGVQICTKVNTTTTTWAACVACPSCTAG
jgi:hypothetical protein